MTTDEEIAQIISQINNLPSKSVNSHITEWWSVSNAMTISASVLIFGLLVLILATYLIRMGQNPESVLKIFGTILIIISAVFLVVAGYTENQMGPVMGLLGTVVGYLLGKRTNNSTS